MANPAVIARRDPNGERTGYSYILRVLGFLLILWAILRKNVGGRRPLR